MDMDIDMDDDMALPHIGPHGEIVGAFWGRPAPAPGGMACPRVQGAAVCRRPGTTAARWLGWWESVCKELPPYPPKNKIEGQNQMG